MATIAVLAAKLQVDGADKFSADVTKAGDAVEGLSKKLKPIPGQLDTFARHLKSAKDSASTFDKQGVAVAMRGSQAFEGKLSVLNKTAFATAQTLDVAGSSAGGLKNTLQGVTQAARGFGGALGGLGSLSPVISAITSPAGLAAAAIGGVVLAVKKLKEANDALDLETLASSFEKIDRAAASTAAGGSALLKGIIDGVPSATLDAIVSQAKEMAKLAGDEADARKTTDELVAKQKKLLKDITSEQEKLNAVPVNNATRDQRKAMQEWIDDAKVRFARLGTQIDQTWAALVPAAKDLASIKSETDKLLETDEKRVDAAKKLREEMEKIRDIAKDSLADVALSLSNSMNVGSGKAPANWKGAGAPGTAMGYGSIMGDIAATGAAIGEAVADSIIERTKSLKSQAMGMAGGLAGSVLQGAAAGPAGIGLALLQASKGFQDTMAEVNAILQTFADVIGETMRPIVPLLQQIGETLRPLTGALAAIAPLITELNPAFMLLSTGVRVLADVVERVARIFAQSILGVLKAIRKALDRMHITFKPLDTAIDSLKKSLRGLDKTSQQLAETFGTILPEGYKLLELRRYQSSPGIATYVGPGGVGSGGGLMAGGGYTGSAGSGITVQGNIELHGIQDVPSLARALAGERRWRGTVRTGRASYSSGSA